ncbi:MAG: sensor histidine kinase [Polyangiales bacterium]
MFRGRLLRKLYVVLWCLFAFDTSHAHAQSSLIDDVSEGRSLAPYLSAYLDASQALTFAQVRTLWEQGKFEPQREPDTSFGFTPSAVWLAWRGDNPAMTAKRYLLELGYPHLDHVSLHVLHADGSLESRETGDMLPFAQRDLADPNFVFKLEARPHARETYFLRIQTSGSARAPLKLWSERAFFAEAQSRNVMLALFCGALTVMALFNLGVFVLIRQREYLYYVFLLVAMSFAMTSFSGHVFQYVLPRHPEIANRSIGISVAFILLFIPMFANAVVERFDVHRERIVYRWAIGIAAGLVVFAMIAPPGVALRGVLVVMATACIAAPPHLRTLKRYNVEQARLYILSWHVVIYAIPIFVLRLMHVIPEFWVSEWIVHITATSSAVITTLALASRVNVMKDDVTRLNRELSANVEELKTALASAELSAEDARRANRIKDDFMATMSHELRTPLNAIINVPQGLIDEFGELSAARCERCGAEFVLDANEQLGTETPCAACTAIGTLHRTGSLEYRGQPDATIRYLRKIERAGTHLLQMVNGVLDISKMEAGRLELNLAPCKLDEIIQDAVEQLSELAKQSDLRIKLVLPSAASASTLDAFRIKQVLLNLLSNAFKFSEPSSTVTVSWELVGDADVVSVRDQGIGIAPENHERIFAGFEQVHTGQTRKYGGTGLGLSISRSLVRMHGGELWVESELKRGAVFRFSLPRSRPAALPADVA